MRTGNDRAQVQQCPPNRQNYENSRSRLSGFPKCCINYMFVRQTCDRTKILRSRYGKPREHLFGDNRRIRRSINNF